MPDDDLEEEIPTQPRNKHPRSELSSVVSDIYGISPKGVRDVWNRYRCLNDLRNAPNPQNCRNVNSTTSTHPFDPLRRTWRHATSLFWDHTHDSESISIAAIAIATTAATIAYKAKILYLNL
jgi:hypothetical protein